MGDESVPVKKEPDEQAHREIDQRDVDNSTNPTPAELRISAAELFMQATEQTRMALCISDPFEPGVPMVYVNEAFVELTGYQREDVIGKNCRLLQGEETQQSAINKIRAALDVREVVVVDILNYRKDGTPFWNALHVGPIFNDDGELAYFYGSQWDITDLLVERERNLRQKHVAEELQHRTDNLFGVIGAIVRLTARGETDADVLADKISDRLQALAVAHRASVASSNGGGSETDLDTLARQILAPYRGTGTDRLEFVGDPISLPPSWITPLGLTLHELATNAIKYGALSSPDGQVCIDWSLKDEELVICWIENGGPKVELVGGKPAVQGGGTGSRLLEGMLRGLDGRIEQTFDEDGLQAHIYLPRPDADQS